MIEAADCGEFIGDLGCGEAGIRAFVTGRGQGDFGLAGSGSVSDISGRWWKLLGGLAAEGVVSMVSGTQVHDVGIQETHSVEVGWRQVPGMDGHIGYCKGLALVVTVADCIPVFLAHPSGAFAVLHAGWRGVAGGILGLGVKRIIAGGCGVSDLSVFLGPGICGGCYEVSADVYSSVTGRPASSKARLDLRLVLAEQARGLGIERIGISGYCTRCDGDRFFSHRAGDSGRQVAVIFRSIGDANTVLT